VSRPAISRIRPSLLRPFCSTTLLHPPLYEKRERSKGRRGVAEEKRRSRRSSPLVWWSLGQVAVIAAGGATAGAVVVVERIGPAEPSSEAPEGLCCPNLPQRPRSRRDTRRETLIFCAFDRGRSRPRAPLWQIWTRSHTGPPQEPHPHHHAKGFVPGHAGTGAWNHATTIWTAVRPGTRRNRRRFADAALGGAGSSRHAPEPGFGWSKSSGTGSSRAPATAANAQASSRTRR